MEEAINELKKISKDEKIIGLYDAEAVERKVRNTELKGARLEGKKQSQLEIAKALLVNNVDIEIIAKATGLTIEEIEKL